MDDKLFNCTLSDKHVPYQLLPPERHCGLRLYRKHELCLINKSRLDEHNFISKCDTYIHVRYMLSPFRLSVCLLSRLKFSAIFLPYDSPGTLVFWCQNSLVGTPLSPWNLRSKWPTPFQTAQFRPISAHSASTVIASKKSSISTYRKSTTRFPTSHRWTVYVTPKCPKGWHKNAISLFAPVKFNFSRKKKDSYKVSLCENFQRQSCSYIIPLSNGP